jgi:hypothetical protein
MVKPHVQVDISLPSMRGDADLPSSPYCLPGVHRRPNGLRGYSSGAGTPEKDFNRAQKIFRLSARSREETTDPGEGYRHRRTRPHEKMGAIRRTTKVSRSPHRGVGPSLFPASRTPYKGPAHQFINRMMLYVRIDPGGPAERDRPVVLIPGKTNAVVK